MIDGLAHGSLENPLRNCRHGLDELAREASRYGHLALVVRNSPGEGTPNHMRNRTRLRDERTFEDGGGGEAGGSGGGPRFDSGFRALIREAYELADRLSRLAAQSGIYPEDSNPIEIPRERKDCP